MEISAEVLVVGAGPVGLTTALHLKRQGVDVKVVDHAEPGSPKSFAVTLHPCSAEMLAEFGLAEPLRWQGHSFKLIALFATGERVARLTLPVDGEFANGGLTLPQNALRTALESALHVAGIEVEYERRLARLEQRSQDVHAWLTPANSPAQREDSPTRRDEVCVRAKFVVGADGYLSTVRQRLGIAMTRVGRERPFAFFDVRQPSLAGGTAELALAEHSSAMVPLRGGNTRYSFELPALPARALGSKEFDELRKAHMPWHPPRVDGIDWSEVRTFAPALAERFGYGRVWLVGDACHVTNPIGAQSLNVGLREARDLAHAIVDCLRGGALEHLATGFGEQRRLEWRRLLAIGAKPNFGPRTPGWAVRYFDQLISSLPASRDDLDDLLEQLGISMI